MIACCGRMPNVISPWMAGHFRPARGSPRPSPPPERGRLPLHELLEPQRPCGGLDPFVDFVAGGLSYSETKRIVLVDAHLRVERLPLHPHRAIALARRHAVAP